MFRLSLLETLTSVLMETNFPLDLIYSNTLLKNSEEEEQGYSSISAGHGGLMSGLLAGFLFGFGVCEVHASQQLFVLLVLTGDPLWCWLEA